MLLANSFLEIVFAVPAITSSARRRISFIVGFGGKAGALSASSSSASFRFCVGVRREVIFLIAARVIGVKISLAGLSVKIFAPFPAPNEC